MQTFFITFRALKQDWNFLIEAHDIREVAARMDAITAGIQIMGNVDKADRPVLTDASTSKRRGVDYINLAEWVR